MKFKYLNEFDKLKLTNCPPSEYKPLRMTAYRFMFQDPMHPNNFKPVFLLNPQRINDAKDYTSKCQGFGLSLFVEEGGAKAKYARFMFKSKGKFAKLVGTYLASLVLTEEDGVGSEPEEYNFSHFNFHEYLGTDLAQKVVDIEKI